MTYKGFEFCECTNEHEKVFCRDFAYRIMLTPEYGLQDISYARNEYDNVENHIYFTACSESNQELIGTSRLICNYGVSQFKNLKPADVSLYRNDNQLTDAGVYIDRSPGERIHIFMGLFAISVRLLLSKKIKGMYIQVRPHHVSLYKRIGFRLVGTLFNVNGWNSQWYPMLLQLDEVSHLFGDKDFQREWQAREGEKLSVAFWKQVMSLHKNGNFILSSK